MQVIDRHDDDEADAGQSSGRAQEVAALFGKVGAEAEGDDEDTGNGVDCGNEISTSR